MKGNHMPIYKGMPTQIADRFRSGEVDAYGNPPEQSISDGSAPCRCCLKLIPAGEEMLILAYRPFKNLHAYAETGPVFLCAKSCRPTDIGFPEIVVSPEYLLRAYSKNEKIIYGTGKITKSSNIEKYASELLTRKNVAFVDLRSAQNNCWQARILSG
jgi:hypothetical protein